MIPVAKPLLGIEEAKAAEAVILSGWLSQGTEVAAFEAEFARTVGAQHACAVSNCTTALHLALMAVGVRPGDEVITASHTFIAAANAIRQCGATPIFVDISPATFNMDPEAVETAVTARTRAILCTHQLGMPCDLGAIGAIARRRGIFLVEDAACALGSEIRTEQGWERIGRPHGDIACFSLHPRKIVTTGEGGMLTTNNPEWDALFRLWRQHGMDLSDAARHAAKQVVFETYVLPGYNYRMTDIQASVGRSQLRRLDGIVAQRRRLAANYRRLLDQVPDVVPPAEPNFVRTNWQSFCVRLPGGADQARVMQAMLDRGVSTRRGVMCIHLEQAAREYPRPFALPHSERARNECLLLPMFDQLTEDMQVQVVDALKEALQ